jgi:hypothetical protein
MRSGCVLAVEEAETMFTDLSWTVDARMTETLCSCVPASPSSGCFATGVIQWPGFSGSTAAMDGPEEALTRELMATAGVLIPEAKSPVASSVELRRVAAELRRSLQVRSEGPNGTNAFAESACMRVSSGSRNSAAERRQELTNAVRAQTLRPRLWGW